MCIGFSLVGLSSLCLSHLQAAFEYCTDRFNRIEDSDKRIIMVKTLNENDKNNENLSYLQNRIGKLEEEITRIKKKLQT